MNWTFIIRKQHSKVVTHTLNVLQNTLSDNGISYSVTASHIGPLCEGLIFIGLSDKPTIYRQSEQMPVGEESFSLCQNGPALLIYAGGELGLAYGILELAERIADEGKSALLHWPNMTCAPGNKVRGADRFITNSQDEQWWMNREYWDSYFKMMLSSRFNSFTLLFGFDTAYFSPPYPFFVDVPGFESVKVAEWFHFDRKECLAALNQIGEMCHDYGMCFTIVLLQHSMGFAVVVLDTVNDL